MGVICVVHHDGCWSVGNEIRCHARFVVYPSLLHCIMGVNGQVKWNDGKQGTCMGRTCEERIRWARWKVREWIILLDGVI